MKKILFVAGFAMITLASCKKDYTCECTSSDGTNEVTTSATITDTKKNATAECDEGDASTTTGGTTYTTECTIK